MFLICGMNNHCLYFARLFDFYNKGNHMLQIISLLSWIALYYMKKRGADADLLLA